MNGLVALLHLVLMSAGALDHDPLLLEEGRRSDPVLLQSAVHDVVDVLLREGARLVQLLHSASPALPVALVNREGQALQCLHRLWPARCLVQLVLLGKDNVDGPHRTSLTLPVAQLCKDLRSILRRCQGIVRLAGSQFSLSQQLQCLGLPRLVARLPVQRQSLLQALRGPRAVAARDLHLGEQLQGAGLGLGVATPLDHRQLVRGGEVCCEELSKTHL
mmetsp:Transcript_5023/g.12259  ORF Transcript_5023/g.12259 Transcript_5023/m.12259 type:complete len:218 (-) Transcript_5023:284-937(-)